MMFEIYGTTNCTYCVMAKELLITHKKEYKFIDVAENVENNAAFFKKFPGVSTVPQVTEPDGHWIGGYVELIEWLKDYG